MKQLPQHLRKYIVEQNYEKYTPVDQACWRFILRQLRAFLTEHAHPCYLDGLQKTGVEIEQIPRIENISAKISEFGWRALPVSGFIPPAAFMELQSLGILPIASEMRSLDHLMYTPAPDIVHEAAGHAPILVDPEFADYLKKYAEIAKKALISKEDLDLYEAIRDLSDIKENPDSSPAEIADAEQRLTKVSQSISHVSEAAELARMNWWTSEYGLIGDMNSPRIYGAGLLSSVGEARECLSEKVKKLPLTADCILQSYDITEPQPQLFVAANFKTLSKVLEQMANQMAFRTGGLEGLKKAIKAATVNTAELNSGIQISGQIVETIVGEDGKTPAYLRLNGPCQLSYDEIELSGHHRDYHNQGFGSAVGYLKAFPQTCPCLLSDKDLERAGIRAGQRCSLEYTSGVKVEGVLKSILRKDGKILLLTFTDCLVTYFGRLLFERSWGVYDLAVGSKVSSVFGGAADREKFGLHDDFEAVRVPKKTYTEKELRRFALYQEVRALRTSSALALDLEEKLRSVLTSGFAEFPADWLLQLEGLEIVTNKGQDKNLPLEIQGRLQTMSHQNPSLVGPINDGLKLVHQL
jgi:phenylalanine-4-hydroxylase